MTSGLPLRGRRILVTRAQGSAGGLIDQLESLGAETVLVPLIETQQVAGRAAILTSMAELRGHDGPAYAVFTSATTARLIATAASGSPALALSGVVIGAVGGATASALEKVGVIPDLVPEPHVAEALAEALVARGVRGARVWLPAAEGARLVLRRRLEQAGAIVDALTLYRSAVPARAAPDLIAALDAGPIDAVALTSGSTVDHLYQTLGDRQFPAGAVAVCIGPVTAARALRAGFPVAAVAPHATTASLAEALAAHYSGTPMDGR